MPTCLLTGATGFIGSHAVRDLSAHGWAVHALVRDPSRIAGASAHTTDGSFASIRAAMAAAHPDVVIHLATCYIKDHRSEQVPELIAGNIAFGTHLLEAMAETHCRRLVNVGSYWQHYGRQDDSYAPATLYAATKQAFDDIARWYADARGLAVTTLHLSDTYGPADPRPKIFGLLARAARSGEPLELSPGQQRLDPLYVGDATAALDVAACRLLAGKAAGFELFRVSPGRPVTLRDLVACWCRVNQAAPDLRWGAKPYRERDAMEPWLGGTVLPGWTARIVLEDGLRQCGHL